MMETAIPLNPNLLYKARKTLREQRAALPNDDGHALLRHDLRVQSELLNELLKHGDDALTTLITRAEGGINKTVLIEAAKKEDEA